MESKEKRIGPILARLAATYPQPQIALTHRNPFELLVATVLSAQSTDVQVNRVTPALFRQYPTPAALAEARLDQLEALIHSTGFYHNKAKNLIGLARLLQERYRGQVPQTMEELLVLPGVARKTANVVLGSAFGKREGIVVDTHVRRVTQRLGLTTQENPEKIEADLMVLVPKKAWIDISLRIIFHGRETCTAKSPACGRCPLLAYCPSAAIFLGAAGKARGKQAKQPAGQQRQT